jgi:hypothetical protein
MEDLRDYSIYYYSEDHPLKEEKKEFKKLYLNLLNHCGCLYLNKNIVKYKLNIFKEKLNFDDEIEELNSDDKTLKRLFKKVLKQYFKLARLKFYTYRYIFFFDCLVLFGEGNKRNTQIFMEELKKIIVPLYHYEIDEVFKNLYLEKFNLDRKFFISEEMLNKFNTIKRFSESKGSNIVFTATMSTGKSTLINAIIGKNIAPSKATACTSNIANFISCPLEGNFLNYSDENGIKIILDLKNTKKLIETSNYCYVNTYFNSIISEKKVNIIDTPGVDFSMDITHGEITRNELKNSNIDILVYVMSAQNFGAKGDDEHLRFIRENVKYKKLILAINMLDTSSSEDDSILDIVSNIKKYLEKLKFKDFIIAPISGRGGLVLKNYLNNYNNFKGDLEEVEHFKRKFTRRKDLELGNFYSEINEGLVLEKYKNENLEEYLKAYVNTGLVSFEQILYNFI